LGTHIEAERFDADEKTTLNGTLRQVQQKRCIPSGDQTVSMSATEAQKAANIYMGRPQPDPYEHLAQIRIFLADEDYHRTLQFAQRLTVIEKYVAFLKENGNEIDKQLLKRIKITISAHKKWITRATQIAIHTIYLYHVHTKELTPGSGHR
jgi:hypothetical protein